MRSTEVITSSSSLSPLLLSMLHGRRVKHAKYLILNSGQIGSNENQKRTQQSPHKCWHIIIVTHNVRLLLLLLSRLLLFTFFHSFHELSIVAITIITIVCFACVAINGATTTSRSSWHFALLTPRTINALIWLPFGLQSRQISSRPEFREICVFAWTVRSHRGLRCVCASASSVHEIVGRSLWHNMFNPYVLNDNYVLLIN